MTLLSPVGRELADGSPSAVLTTARGLAPPPLPVEALRAADSGAAASNVDRVRFLARALLTSACSEPFNCAQLEAAVDEVVVLWAPALHLRSRLELVHALVQSDDAIRDVVLTFAGQVATAEIAMVEWMATGRFAGPAFIDDDVLVEPTGAVVHVAGSLSATFRSGRATRICCYFDRLAVVEQMRPTARPGRVGSGAAGGRPPIAS